MSKRKAVKLIKKKLTLGIIVFIIEVIIILAAIVLFSFKPSMEKLKWPIIGILSINFGVYVAYYKNSKYTLKHQIVSLVITIIIYFIFFGIHEPYTSDLVSDTKMLVKAYVALFIAAIVVDKYLKYKIKKIQKRQIRKTIIK